MNPLIRTGTVLLTFLCASMAAWAQPILDPTRPPPDWLPTKPGAEGIASPSAANGGEAPPQLQSLLVSSSRRFAIIEGQLLTVGDAFRDSRVVEVRSTEVLLRSERGTQTLKLFPDVQLHPAKTVAKKSKSPQTAHPSGDRRSIVIKETK